MRNESTIAIVGRPNVGKSALFNRLAKKRISIVHDQPGVTRDRISAPCAVTQHPAELIDTGGIGATIDDVLTEQVTAEADIALHEAGLVLLVVDARDGITPIDESLAQLLRKAEAKVWLIANKIDDHVNESLKDEFTRLGFGEIFPTSAEHGRGIKALAEALDGHLADFAEEIEEEQAAEKKEGIRLAIVGRPNVGKSSLVNAILKNDRTIVSDLAGTTRDAVDIAYQQGGVRYTLIDTAGIRRRGKMDSPVEIFSSFRAQDSIERSDLCLLVIDSAVGVTAQDRKIAKLILKAHKPCVLIMNKFDLFFPEGRRQDRIAEITDHVRRELFFLHYAPIAAVSAKNRESIGRTFNAVDTIRKTAASPLTTGAINRLFLKALTVNPPPLQGGRRGKILYATVRTDPKFTRIPAPEYVLFVNQRNRFKDTYLRYLENFLRESHDHTGLPIQFKIRDREKRKS
ncbi:MAG: ribosome biogenesis GTPase Der [Verrucomicrobiota bacterium]